MKKYFYTEGSSKYGPFTLEELTEKNISRETLVWFHELEDWKPAGKVSELNEIFKFSPPPIPISSSPQIPVSNLNDNDVDTINLIPPRTYFMESILVTLFCFLPFGIAGIVNAAKVESRFNAGDFEGVDNPD